MVPSNLQQVVEKDLKAVGLTGFSVMFVKPEFEMEYIRNENLSGSLYAAEGQLLCKACIGLEPDRWSSSGLDLGEVHKAFKELSFEKKLHVYELSSRNREVSVTIELLYGCPWSRRFLEYFLHLVGPRQLCSPTKPTL